MLCPEEHKVAPLLCTSVERVAWFAADRDFDYNNILGPRSSGLSGENGMPETPTASMTFPRRSTGEFNLTTNPASASESFELRTGALFTAVGRKPGELDTPSASLGVDEADRKREMLFTAVGRKPDENGSGAAANGGPADGKREDLYTAVGRIPEEQNGAPIPAHKPVETAAAPPPTPPPTPAADLPAALSASESASPNDKRTPGNS